MTVARMLTQSNLMTFDLSLDAAFASEFSPRHVEAHQLLERGEDLGDVDDEDVEEAIEHRVNGQPHVLALHQDRDAIEQAREELAPFGGRVTLRQTNFRDADKILDELGVQKIGGALLDLGVSSYQLENAARGFSMMRNGPLDMRMDPRSTITAAAVVNGYSEEDLTHLFRELGEEPAARRIASLIVKMRKDAPFVETLQLARAIEKVVGRHGRRHPATQAFQALRMEVNDELGALEQGMRVLTARLESGARIAVITFHSLEDRIVKNFIRDHSREWLDRPEWPEPKRNPEYDLRAITSKPIEPGENERRMNPRSRSAKLRVAEKIG